MKCCAQTAYASICCSGALPEVAPYWHDSLQQQDHSTYLMWKVRTASTEQGVLSLVLQTVKQNEDPLCYPMLCQVKCSLCQNPQSCCHMLSCDCRTFAFQNACGHVHAVATHIASHNNEEGQIQATTMPLKKREEFLFWVEDPLSSEKPEACAAKREALAEITSLWHQVSNASSENPWLSTVKDEVSRLHALGPQEFTHLKRKRKKVAGVMGFPKHKKHAKKDSAKAARSKHADSS